MLPSGQHCDPLHSTLVPGHFTAAPTAQCAPGAGVGPGGGVGDGEGGCGPGGSGPGCVQSTVFGFGQHWKRGSADGHVIPPAQHSLPAHMLPLPPGHGTESPILHVPFWNDTSGPCAHAGPAVDTTVAGAAQTQAGSAPSLAGFLVALPLLLMMCSIVPLPLRKTPRGATNEVSSATGHVIPLWTVTAKSRKKWYTPAP